MHRLRVAGVRATGSGYPNAEQTLRMLGDHGVAVVSDLGYSLPDGLHLWRLREKGVLAKVALLARVGLLNGYSLLRVLATRRDRNVPVYVPYPSIFFLWLLSWLPVAARPRCIADAYISIWDTLFRDRGGDAAGWSARLIKSMEGRALRAAWMVLVDTQANRDMMVADFDLATERVRAWPLAIDEARFLASPGYPALRTGRIRILFVGTLIPLHGISVLLDALRILQTDCRLEFRIVGDGQLGPLVERFMQDCPAVRLTWVREWCSLDDISAEIAAADICLGVFGGDGKASRVLPFKLYMYLAAGKAVVTQARLSTPEDVPCPPVETIQSGRDDELADAIRRLAENSTLRDQRGTQARSYYGRWLANANLAQRWQLVLDALASTR